MPPPHRRCTVYARAPLQGPKASKSIGFVSHRSLSSICPRAGLRSVPRPRSLVQRGWHRRNTADGRRRPAVQWESRPLMDHHVMRSGAGDQRDRVSAGGKTPANVATVSGRQGQVTASRRSARSVARGWLRRSTAGRHRARAKPCVGEQSEALVETFIHPMTKSSRLIVRVRQFYSEKETQP